MAFSAWWSFTAGMIDSDRNEGGVYEFANSSGTIIYIGSSNDVKRRLLEHYNGDGRSCVKKNTEKYRIEYRSDFAKAEQTYYDDFVRLNGTSPQCNDVRPTG